MALHVKRALAAVLIAPIRLYQRTISPLFGRRCKYHPTCSQYAVEAIRGVGPARGTVVALWRLARCNPWSHGGYDPVSARTLFADRGAEAAKPNGEVPV